MLNLPFSLSFSKLKAYAESPRKLKEYIDGNRKASDAMNAGSLVDCVLFEPEKVQERFMFVDKFERKSDKAKAQWAEFEAEAKATNRTLMFKPALVEATAEADLVRLDPVVKALKLYDNAVAVQEFIETAHPKYFGFKHRGVIDARCPFAMWDLKRMGNFNSARMRYEITGNLLHLQGRIYTQKYDLPFYNVVVTGSDVVVIKQSADTLNEANILWVKLLNKLAGEAQAADLFGAEYWDDFYKQGISYWSENTNGTFTI
jgi:hypothetical protein